MAEILVNLTHHHPCSIQQNFVHDTPRNRSSHCRLYNLLTCTYSHYLIANIWTLLQTRQNCVLACPYIICTEWDHHWRKQRKARKILSLNILFLQWPILTWIYETYQKEWEVNSNAKHLGRRKVVSVLRYAPCHRCIRGWSCCSVSWPLQPTNCSCILKSRIKNAVADIQPVHTQVKQAENSTNTEQLQYHKTLECPI